jgi:hypothetical protein
MTPEQQRQLDELGFVALPGFMSPPLLAELRTRIAQLLEEEGDEAGSEFKQEPGCRRLANLVDKGEVFARIVALPELHRYVGHVLGGDFKLSSANARSVNPHGDRTQPLHADMSALPDARGYWVCNTVWMLDDFTAANGALRVVPGSHRWGMLPGEKLTDPSVAHPEEVLITGTAGTVVVMNAHAWHGGTANRTARPRTAVHLFFCRRDRPQQQYQKRLLREEVQRTLSPELRRVLALDDPLNDAVSAEVATRSGFLK